VAKKANIVKYLCYPAHILFPPSNSPARIVRK
jgi:hypothetical protein